MALDAVPPGVDVAGVHNYFRSLSAFTDFHQFKPNKIADNERIVRCTSEGGPCVNAHPCEAFLESRASGVYPLDIAVVGTYPFAGLLAGSESYAVSGRSLLQHRGNSHFRRSLCSSAVCGTTGGPILWLAQT